MAQNFAYYPPMGCQLGVSCLPPVTGDEKAFFLHFCSCMHTETRVGLTETVLVILALHIKKLTGGVNS